MIKKIALVGLVGVSGLLASCARSSAEPYSVSVAQHQALVNELKTEGMQVIQEGFTLRVILPDQAFFAPQTDQLQAARQADLASVASMILTYNQPQVLVNGYYDDNDRSPAKLKAKSLRKAKVVAAYLWNHGVPVDEIKVQGFGKQDTVASNATPAGTSANRRVEVLVIGK